VFAVWGATPEEIQAEGWRRWQFTPESEAFPGGDEPGRTAAVLAALPAGGAVTFMLEPTPAPSWFTRQHPEQAWVTRQSALRLELTCHHSEWGSWTLLCDLGITGGHNTFEVPEQR
jgi:hypothetical protein